MKIDYLEIKGTWREVFDAARTTIGMDKGDKEPSDKAKKAILLSEHSPIRLMQVKWKWTGIPYWVSVHFTRHKIGIEHFVSTQRTDLKGIDRDKIPQNAPVDHECIANFQAIINISRKRCCFKSAKETREAWNLVLDGVSQEEWYLSDLCVPECWYRGFCPELESCGESKKKDFKLNRYYYINND